MEKVEEEEEGEERERKEEEEDKTKERYCHKNMLTSHVNCLEETGHCVEAHGMWNMLFLNDCGIGQNKQRRHKSRIMHCSTFHHEY